MMTIELGRRAFLATARRRGPGRPGRGAAAGRSRAGRP